MSIQSLLSRESFHELSAAPELSSPGPNVRRLNEEEIAEVSGSYGIVFENLSGYEYAMGVAADLVNFSYNYYHWTIRPATYGGGENYYTIFSQPDHELWVCPQI